jgi:hypothetical protein
VNLWKISIPQVEWLDQPFNSSTSNQLFQIAVALQTRYKQRQALVIIGP